MGMKEYHKLSSDDMAKIIGTSRQTYENKMKTGKFSPLECKLFCEYFGKSFGYLFSTIDEIDAHFGAEETAGKEAQT
jgi:DNA-binding XRE family transcriptional regulator